MTPAFWQALERLGANGAAACDWQRQLGADWNTCRVFLKKLPGHAPTVVDPDRPTRRLAVVPDAPDGFLGVVDDEEADRQPLVLEPEDVAVHQPDWWKIAERLGQMLDFSANCYETQGLARQIGTAQDGSYAIRSVVLCLPAGHFGDHAQMLRDVSARQDATILLPSERWVTPPLQAVASANRLSMVGLVERCRHLLRGQSVGVSNLGTPVVSAGLPRKNKPCLVIQPGWRWDMVRVVVAPGGRLLFSCDGHTGEHSLPKTTAKKPNQALGIMMTLAVKHEWTNPTSGAADHERVRKNFQRLEKLLRNLVPLPGKPFRNDAGKFIPHFKITLHPDLVVGAARGNSPEKSGARMR